MTLPAFLDRRAELDATFRDYIAAQLRGDKTAEAELRVELNERFGLALRDWMVEFGDDGIPVYEGPVVECVEVA